MMFRKIEMLYNGGLIARRTWKLEGEWGVPLKCNHLACPSFHSFLSVIRIFSIRFILLGGSCVHRYNIYRVVSHQNFKVLLKERMFNVNNVSLNKKSVKCATLNSSLY